MTTRDSKPIHATERGMILIPLLMISILIGALTIVLLEESVGEVRRVDFAEKRLRALEIAEIGLLRAEMEIRGEYDVDGDGLGTLSGSVGGGSYDVVATPLEAGEGRYRLRSRGVRGLAVRRIEACVRLLPSSYFAYALFAKESVRLNGQCWSDAYDSNFGTYEAQRTHWNDVLKQQVADVGGHVGSNGGIRITGHGGILGDAIPGAIDVTRINGTAFVTGSMTPRSEDRELPDPPEEAFLAALNDNANHTIDTSNVRVEYDATKLTLKARSGASIHLDGGTYIFHTVDIGGSGDLTIGGPSIIYITDKLELGTGSVRVLSGRSGDCLIYGHAYDLPAGSRHRSQTIRLGSKSASTMAVYAPTFTYSSHGGGDLFGAIVADTIVLTGGAGLHFDRGLARIRHGGGGTERIYWMED